MQEIFAKYPIKELAEMLATNRLSCSEMVEESISNYNKYESKVNAWVYFDQDFLRKQAIKAQTSLKDDNVKPLLFGIPFGIKDIFNTKNMPTQMGSQIWKDFHPGNNARVVDSLINEGAIVAGKTETAEFAVHSLNNTNNPHDMTRTPGTSSSGSAAAVSTGMVPYALATQTAGSIIRPASFCGVWGMKPSFGLIPRTGVLKTTDTLDTIGFLASHGNSLRPILDSIRVRGPDYPYVYKNIDKNKSGNVGGHKKYKLGFIKTHVWEGAEEYVKDSILHLVKQIDLLEDYEVTEIKSPEILSYSHEVHSKIYNKSLSYYFQNEAKVSDYVSPIMKDMIEKGKRISVEDFRKSLVMQEQITGMVDKLFDGYDLILSIGTSSAAPLRGENELNDPSLIWTLARLPAIAAPCFRAPDSLPFAVQFISKRWNDYVLLSAVERLIELEVIPSGSAKIL